MKKVFVCALALVGILPAATAGAQTQPSSKAAVQTSRLTLVEWSADNTDWETVLQTTIRTSEQKDLFVGVSLQTGLFTDTLVRSKGGTADTATAAASVEVRVKVTGPEGVRYAEPGDVIFDKRSQTLMAKFGGVLSGCADLDGDGHISLDECTLEEEELQLILDTLAAHHFNFALDDLGSGVHAVEVQARIATTASFGAGSATAKAMVGKGAVTVEEVRLLKDVDFTK
jgi:hypothetical protein